MHHIKVNQDYTFFGGCHERNGKEGMDYLLNLSDPPDAVFAVNDPVALGAYEAIKNKGLTIPDDIAVIGFSNNPISAVVHPPLTTINQPAYEMGNKTAELLIEQINNGHHELEPKQEVLKTSLIIRQST